MIDQQPVLEPVEPTSPAMPASRRKSNRTGNLLLAAAGIVAIGGIAFAAGRFTAPAAAVTPGNGNGNFGLFPGGSFDPGSFPGGQGGPGQGGPGAGPGNATLRGEVTAVSDSAITLELENGSTIDVPIDESTDYQAATESAPSEVVVGSSVLVQSSDVSFTPGAGPGASFDPSNGQPQLTVGAAEQVIVLDE